MINSLRDHLHPRGCRHVLGGSGLAQQIQDNIALTGSPTTIEEAPVLPTHINVYVNDTFGAIGTTKLTRDFTAVWRCQETNAAIWPLE